MFVQNFLKRKPIRTAIKRIFKGDNGQRRELTYVINTRTVTSLKFPEEFYICRLTLGAQHADDNPPSTAENPNWPWSLEVNKLQSGEDENTEFFINYAPYLVIKDGNDMNNPDILSVYKVINNEGDLVDVSITAIETADGLFEKKAGFKPENIQYFQQVKLAKLTIEDLRILFKRMFYDFQTDTTLLFLSEDIEWINANLLICTPTNRDPFSWNVIGVEQYPGWYDNLSEENKKLFPSERKKADMTTNDYMTLLSTALNTDTVNAVLEKKGTEEFEQAKTELISKAFLLIHCIGIDHELAFWYRPVTTDVQFTKTNAFCCLYNNILVTYEYIENNETKRISLSLFDFVNGFDETFPELIDLTLHYNVPDLPQLSPSVSLQLENYLNAINSYIDGDKVNILNLTSEYMKDLYTNLHSSRGILYYLDMICKQTNETTVNNAIMVGLLVAKGVLAPRWQIIYDAFCSIVDKTDDGQYIYYKNIDFDKLLNSSYSGDEAKRTAIINAVWEPWDTLSTKTVKTNIISFVEMKEDTDYWLKDNSYLTTIRDSEYKFEWESSAKYWTRNLVDYIAYEYCVRYLEFYAKWNYFNAQELKRIFYNVIDSFDILNKPWQPESIIALCGDLQIWQKFLDIDPTMPVVTRPDGKVWTNVWQRIIDIYGHVNTDGSPIPQYWVIEKDRYENISHLEDWYKTQTESGNALKDWKYQHQFIRTFGERSDKYDSYPKPYQFNDYTSKFTSDIGYSYQQPSSDNDPISNGTYAVIDKRYYNPVTVSVPDFNHWNQTGLLYLNENNSGEKGIKTYKSYMYVDKDYQYETTWKSFYTYKVCSIHRDNSFAESEPNDWYTNGIELPLYSHKDLRIAWQEPSIDFSAADPTVGYTVEEKARIRNEYETWIQECNRIEKRVAEQVHKQLECMIMNLEIAWNESSSTITKTIYSVDSYLDDDIDRLLNNILEDSDAMKGVFAYDKAIYNYVISHLTELQLAYSEQNNANEHIPDEYLYGRFHYENTRSTGFKQNYDGIQFDDKERNIRPGVSFTAL